jgi:nucleotide-binding universal stress UspA family protein
VTEKMGSASAGGEVFVAYDGTEAGRLALALACDLAESRERRVRVVIATRRSPRYSESMAETKEALTRAERAARRLRSEVDAYCHERGISARAVVRPGSVRAETRRIVRGGAEDRIVVAAVRSGGFRLPPVAGLRAYHAIAVLVPKATTLVSPD